jgi:UDP-N-acetylglucosamine transferase subunit ALG13
VILVTVGTNEARFDRLLQALEALPSGTEIVVQHGPSGIRPSGARCFDYLAFDDLVQLIRRASVVITHAGVGSIMTALANGRRPVVVPRLVRFGEAVDDHQLEFGRRAAQAGLVRLVEEPDDLAVAVAEESEVVAVPHGPDTRLVHELRDYISAAVTARARYSR